MANEALIHIIKPEPADEEIALGIPSLSTGCNELKNENNEDCSQPDRIDASFVNINYNESTDDEIDLASYITSLNQNTVDSMSNIQVETKLAVKRGRKKKLYAPIDGVKRGRKKKLDAAIDGVTTQGVANENGNLTDIYCDSTKPNKRGKISEELNQADSSTKRPRGRPRKLASDVSVTPAHSESQNDLSNMSRTKSLRPRKSASDASTNSVTQNHFSVDLSESVVHRKHEPEDIVQCEKNLSNTSSSTKSLLPHKSASDTNTNSVTQNHISIDLSESVIHIKHEPEDIVEMSSELFQPKQLGIDLLSNVNRSGYTEQRSVFMGHTESGTGKTELWLNLMARCNRGSSVKYQCCFCPLLQEIPKDVSDHMQEEHEGLSFAIDRRKEILINPLIYRYCRHCDFVTSDLLAMWIHFEIYHGVVGILDSGDAPIAKADLDEELVSLADNCARKHDVVYVCIDCRFISDERSRTARHVVREHGPSAGNFNGYFVRQIEIRRPLRADYPTSTMPSSFSEILVSSDWSEIRRHCFVCFVCGYKAYSAYSAISHYVNKHHHLRLLQECTCPLLETSLSSSVVCSSQCLEQFTSEQLFHQHLLSRHRVKADGTTELTTSVTILEPSKDQHPLAEGSGSALGSALVPGTSLSGLVECKMFNRG